MKTDAALRLDVLDELAWEPSIDASRVAVAANDGVVTLSGYVPRYAEKLEAERITKSVAGVRAVANDLEVRLPTSCERKDADIATAALNALDWHTSLPRGKIAVTVRCGWLTLEGEVDWQFQRQAARDAVRYLTGVKGVINEITLAERPKPKDIKAKIAAAIQRSGEVDARQISVHTRNGTVTLKGNVASWAERSAAERLAWAAPGVTVVENDLMVGD